MRLRSGLIKSLVALAALLTAFCVYLDAQIVDYFEQHRYQPPARVHARPLLLREGELLSEERLTTELAALGYRFVAGLKEPGEAHREAGEVAFWHRGFRFAEGDEPARRLRLRFAGGRITELRQEDGRDVASVRLEPLEIGSIETRLHEDRQPLAIDQVPQPLIAILLAVEDRRFFDHHGISLWSILRASWANLRAGQVEEGGSTLTQQLVKNLFLSGERSLWRKGVEALMALLLELHYDKSLILETYLNEIYLGQQGPRAIHGVELASRHYFSRPLDQLNLPEMALLVGMIKGPSLYDPFRDPVAARGRRDVVIERLLAERMITPEQATASRNAPLGVRAREFANQHPAYLDLVRRELQHDQVDLKNNINGLRIFTHLDPEIQRQAERALREGIDALERKHALPAGTLNGAVVMAEIDSGQVVAVVGDRQGTFFGFNRALDSRRPIGSLIKPAVYLTALTQPSRYRLDTPLEDQPLRLRDASGRSWSPGNYDQKSHGSVPLYRALANSYNQATVRLGLDLGLPQVIRTLHQLGVEQPIAAYPSLLLGTLERSPLELLQIYQTIAAGGRHVPLHGVGGLTAQQGVPPALPPVSAEQRFDAAEVALLHHGLYAVVTEGTARRLDEQLGIARRVIGKTGTTNDQRDSWFAGFDGRYVAVVWLGRDDNQPMPLTGATGALEVTARLYGAIDSRPWRWSAPAGVQMAAIQTAAGCRELPFVSGSEPVQSGCGVGSRLGATAGEAAQSSQSTVKGTLKSWFNRLLGR